MLTEYIFNNLKTEKLDNKILITTDHASWLALKKEEYRLLKQHKLYQNINLFKSLEKKGVILTKKNKPIIINSYRNRYEHLFRGTSLHIVIPTLRCDHKCIYCHSKALAENVKGKDMDEETAKKTVNFIFQSPSKAICIEFQGGESLLNFPIVRYIIDYTRKINKKHKKNLRIDLVTNLTKMDNDILKYLIKEKIGICTSLDGPKELHNKNRKYLSGESSYDDVIYWIKKIKQEYKYPLNALMVTTRFSLPFYKEIVDEYIKLNFTRIQLKFLNNLGYAKSVWNKISYTPEEYLTFWRNSMDYILKLNTKKQTITELLTTYILQKILTKKSPYLDLNSPCGAAIGQLLYNEKGDIYCCDESKIYDLFKLGNVKNNNYKEILTSNKVCSIITASINDTLLCDACAWKPFCGICPVCNYAETGNLIPKLAINPRCKIYKGIFNYIFKKILDPKYKKILYAWTK